ncbi:MAG: septal ring factor EnvC (AmiA/AmiB activator) [Bermanella sp.]|jgi:septal ring factor EnvC (AmiA/AmiB activator)
MPYIAAGAFILGMAVSYLLFARTASKQVVEFKADLRSAKDLLDEAEEERSGMKQQLADLDYKAKELEKDLSFEKSKTNS